MKGWEEKKEKRWRTNRKTDRKIHLKVKERRCGDGRRKENEARKLKSMWRNGRKEESGSKTKDEEGEMEEGKSIMMETRK